MAGFIPEKKIFKTENNLLIMQDGRTTSEEITVYDFYTKVNEFTKLLSADSTFLTFVSGAFPDNDSLNLFMDSISPLTKQIKAVQTMKQKKAKLTIACHGIAKRRRVKRSAALPACHGVMK